MADHAGQPRHRIASGQLLDTRGLDIALPAGTLAIGAVYLHLHAALQTRKIVQPGVVGHRPGVCIAVHPNRHAIDREAACTQVGDRPHQLRIDDHFARMPLGVETNLQLVAQIHRSGGSLRLFVLIGAGVVNRAGAAVGGAIEHHTAEAGDGAGGNARAARADAARRGHRATAPTGSQ